MQTNRTSRVFTTILKSSTKFTAECRKFLVFPSWINLVVVITYLFHLCKKKKTRRFDDCSVDISLIKSIWSKISQGIYIHPVASTSNSNEVSVPQPDNIVVRQAGLHKI